MTLSEWSRKTGVLPTYPTTERGAVSVLADRHTPHLRDLFDLDDYAVGSRHGVVLWLVPKPSTREEMR